MPPNPPTYVRSFSLLQSDISLHPPLKVNSSAEKRFPKLKVVAHVDKSEIHLYYMVNNLFKILYEVVIIADVSYYISNQQKHRSLDVIEGYHKQYIVKMNYTYKVT